VPVAIILSAIAHRLVRVWPAFGGANPGLPVSNAMVVMLRISCHHNHNRSRHRFGRIWALTLKNKGDSVKYG